MNKTGHLLYFLIPARHTDLGIKSYQLCRPVIAKGLKTKRLGFRKRQGKFTRLLISQISVVFHPARLESLGGQGPNKPVLDFLLKP